MSSHLLCCCGRPRCPDGCIEAKPDDRLAGTGGCPPPIPRKGFYGCKPVPCPNGCIATTISDPRSGTGGCPPGCRPIPAGCPKGCEVAMPGDPASGTGGCPPGCKPIIVACPPGCISTTISDPAYGTGGCPKGCKPGPPLICQGCPTCPATAMLQIPNCTGSFTAHSSTGQFWNCTRTGGCSYVMSHGTGVCSYPTNIGGPPCDAQQLGTYFHFPRAACGTGSFPCVGSPPVGVLYYSILFQFAVACLSTPVTTGSFKEATWLMCYRKVSSAPNCDIFGAYDFVGASLFNPDFFDSASLIPAPQVFLL